ncbi:hypothetical protein CPter291_5307 [Collimonas pratensis]|uniref:Uncharacterized protein n=1 Tax=Collimonas pratensis TaxID=279113 RepID=A0ABM5ZED4_9BURK|nr:hypothetical protein CPter291_5307 [Collimonas pratensis]
MNRTHPVLNFAHGLFLVVINDFDVFYAIASPDEANAPLIVNPDTVLSGAISN